MESNFNNEMNINTLGNVSENQRRNNLLENNSRMKKPDQTLKRESLVIDSNKTFDFRRKNDKPCLVRGSTKIEKKTEVLNTYDGFTKNEIQMKMHNESYFQCTIYILNLTVLITLLKSSRRNYMDIEFISGFLQTMNKLMTLVQFDYNAVYKIAMLLRYRNFGKEKVLFRLGIHTFIS